MIGSRKARSWLALLLSGSAVLAGCDMLVLRPSGDVAAQQSLMIVMSTLLMLLIIVPVIVLTLVFAWRYRASNIAARFTPDWDHSVQLELLIWAAPLLIIILLGALTWIGTHTLDPYRPLSRIFAVFLDVGVRGGAPVPLMAFGLLFASSYFSVITPKGGSQNIIFVGSGYLTQRELYKLGFFTTLAFLVVFLVIGTPWVFFVTG